MDAPEELGRDHVGPPGPRQLLERLTHDPLRLAAGVDLGVVEEVDAGVVGVLHALEARVEPHLAPERDPRSEREDAELQARIAHAAVLHLHVRAPVDVWLASSSHRVPPTNRFPGSRVRPPVRFAVRYLRRGEALTLFGMCASQTTTTPSVDPAGA